MRPPYLSCNYFERNAACVRYPKFRKQGLFVGSGVIEAGCKTLIATCPWQIGTVSRFNAMSHCYTEAKQQFARHTLDLPAGQDELIQAVAKANKNTIVVINAGGPVLMGKWIEQVPAVLHMWYGGQEGGNAIASILFGDANPSGKLPVSFVKRWEDSPAYGHYPGENLQVEYAEGIYVGYRYFDTRNVEPLFPFGYGLSYTKFAYSDLKVSPSKKAGQPVEVPSVPTSLRQF